MSSGGRIVFNLIGSPLHVLDVAKCPETQWTESNIQAFF